MAKEESNNVGKQGKKLTYEELVQLAQQANLENQKLRQLVAQLRGELSNYQMQDYYQRLSWLWQVIVLDKPVFPEDFVKAKIEEFIDLMTPVQHEEPVNGSKGE